MGLADELHERAMDLADQGDALRKGRDHDGARLVFERALDHERRAAESVTNEPSRGILYRSAGWLALEAMHPREAERLAAIGLGSPNVCDRVAEELRVVLEDARVRLHIALPPPSAVSSIGVEIEGPDIGHGDADPAEVLPRVEALRAVCCQRCRMPRGGATYSIEGEICAADETLKRKSIKLVQADAVVIPVEVSEALLEDIVRPFYGRLVRLQVVPAARGWRRMVGVPELLDG